MQKIIILDFASGSVYASYFPEELDNAEDWFDSEFNIVNLREKNCHYMVVDASLEVNLLLSPYSQPYLNPIHIL